MNQAAETKVCPFCAETIKAVAKKCPFCNSRLVRYALLRQELSLGFAVLICFAAFVFVCVTMFPESPDDFISHGRNFLLHRGDLKVAGLDVSIETRGTNDFYYAVSGLVTNQGRLPWKIQSFELNISNKQGVVDIRHEQVRDWFVVLPASTHAFVFHCPTILSNPVVSAQARVENALDGNLVNNQ